MSTNRLFVILLAFAGMTSLYDNYGFVASLAGMVIVWGICWCFKRLTD